MTYSIALNGKEFLGAVPSDMNIQEMLAADGVEFTEIVTGCTLSDRPMSGFSTLHESPWNELIDGFDGKMYRFVLKAI
jgi:hypothetical protein